MEEGAGPGPVPPAPVPAEGRAVHCAEGPLGPRPDLGTHGV